jgi:hypothetical protein
MFCALASALLLPAAGCGSKKKKGKKGRTVAEQRNDAKAEATPDRRAAAFLKLARQQAVAGDKTGAKASALDAYREFYPEETKKPAAKEKAAEPEEEKQPEDAAAAKPADENAAAEEQAPAAEQAPVEEKAPSAEQAPVEEPAAPAEERPAIDANLAATGSRPAMRSARRSTMSLSRKSRIPSARQRCWPMPARSMAPRPMGSAMRAGPSRFLRRPQKPPTRWINGSAPRPWPP